MFAEFTCGIAGPAAELEPLLAKLKAEEVFVRELDTLGIAYHSPGLRAYVDELTDGMLGQMFCDVSLPGICLVIDVMCLTAPAL